MIFIDMAENRPFLLGISCYPYRAGFLRRIDPASRKYQQHIEYLNKSKISGERIGGKPGAEAQ